MSELTHPNEKQNDQEELFNRVMNLLNAHAESALADEELIMAQSQLETFLAAHPESAFALRLIAELSQQLRQTEQTRRYIKQAEALDPWNMEILIIAESLHEVDPQEPNLQHAEVQSSSLPADASTTSRLMEKAMGSFRLGGIDRAYSLAKLAFLLDPQDGQHLLDLWSIGAALDPQRTRQELILLVSELDQQPYLFLALGSINNVLGQYDEASEWLEQGLSREMPDAYVHAMLLNELAYVLIRKNERLNEAIRLARKALELFPEKNTNGFIRDTVGLAYIKMEQTDKAVRNLREAVAKDPTSIPRLHLAIALLLEHNPQDALVELETIASARATMESPHLEETTILQRIQSNFPQLRALLSSGKMEDSTTALSILDGLI
jgi:tetratricopeptide (TPR) repeat protein